MSKRARDENSIEVHSTLRVPWRLIWIHPAFGGSATFLRALALTLCLFTLSARCEDPSDPVLDLLMQKGIVTEAEVAKAKADAERIRTNQLATMMPPLESKWKINNAIKNVELFGDLRAR